MPNYTVTNLREVEDSAAGRGPGVEARFGRKHLDSEHLGVSYFRYEPNFRAPIGHSHKVQEEVYVVIGGSGRMKLDDEVIDVQPWDAVRVAPETVRAFEGGPDGLEIIAVGGDKPEGGDGVMVEGFWSD
jgi:mannose-6-phosphate isomerase-like protein (cupin superfamily)